MAKEQLNTSFSIKTTHPGVVLSAILEQKGISQRDLADAIGKATPIINDIIKGKRNINAELAVLFEASIGELSAQDWMSIQSLYDIECLQEESRIIKQKEQIDTWNKLREIINISKLKKKANIKGGIGESIQTVFSYAGVSDIAGLEKKVKGYLSCFKKSETVKTDPQNLLTWVIIARHISKEQDISPQKYDNSNLETLIDSLNAILYKNVNMYQELKSVLNRHGIKFVIEEKLDKVPVDGYSFWDGDNPTIVMTRRYDRIDNFGFTLMHELGHICLHLKGDKSADYLETDQSTTEREGIEAEANDFASKSLLRDMPYKGLFSRIQQPYAAANYLMAMSNNYSVNVGIIIGQYHHYLKEKGWDNPYSVCRNLIQKVNL